MSTEAQSEFLLASKLISEKKYSEAREKLIALREKNFVSADLESNLGRALVEDGHLGHGTWHYMVAIRMDRFNSEHRRDLEFAQSKVESGMAMPMRDPSEWGYAFSTYLRPAEALSIGSITLLAMLFLKIYKNIPRRIVITLSIVASLFVAGAGLGMLGKKVVIIASDASLRDAPLESSSVIQPVKGGARAHLIRKSGDFSEIERTGAFRGWINSRDLLTAP